MVLSRATFSRYYDVIHYNSRYATISAPTLGAALLAPILDTAILAPILDDNLLPSLDWYTSGRYWNHLRKSWSVMV